LVWWDQIVERKRMANEVMTITTEFGPYPYMVYDPVTHKPIASQWNINLFMLSLLKKRYTEMHVAETALAS